MLATPRFPARDGEPASFWFPLRQPHSLPLRAKRKGIRKWLSSCLNSELCLASIHLYRALTTEVSTKPDEAPVTVGTDQPTDSKSATTEGKGPAVGAGEIKNAQIVFDAVWNKVTTFLKEMGLSKLLQLMERYLLSDMIFPKGIQAQTHLQLHHKLTPAFRTHLANGCTGFG